MLACCASCARSASTDGLVVVTLRAVGAAAGVSPGAPDRHFLDKSDLLAAVAAEALLARSTGRPVHAAAQDTVDPATLVDRAMRAYVDMALGSPALYSLTFGMDALVAQSPELHDAGLGAYGLLHRPVKDASRSHSGSSPRHAHAGGDYAPIGHARTVRPHRAHSTLHHPLTLVRHAAIALLGIDLSATS